MRLLLSGWDTIGPVLVLLTSGCTGPSHSEDLDGLPSRLRIEPAWASLSAGDSLQFEAIAEDLNGPAPALRIRWSATGGRITPDGRYTADLSAGHFQVAATSIDGRLTAAAPVEVVEEQVPQRLFPREYDPARLGDSLLAGQTWQGLALGSSEVITWGGIRPREWVYATPPAALARIVADPVFDQVYRFVQPADARRRANAWPGTVQLIHHLPRGQSRIWVRVVLKVDSENPGGFTSRGTLTPGGSTTYKMMFLRSSDGQQRHEFELYNGGDFLLMGTTKPGNNIDGETSVRLGQGGAPVPPVTRGSNKFEGNQPLAGWLNSRDNGGDFLSSRDWFEFVINYEFVNGTVLQRFFIRRLTEDGLWKPSTHPAWLGWRTTGTQARDYTELWLGANKSQSNDGPGDQFVFVGPWEVSSKADPYGWDRYGRE